MLSDLPKRIVDINPFTHWCNKLIDYLIRIRLQSSSDILVNETLNGTTLRLVRQPNIINTPSAAPTTPVPFGAYNNAISWSAGTFTRVQTPIGTTTPVGIYLCINAVPANGTGNMIPQYPEPTTGTVYWIFFTFGVQTVGVCNGGSSGGNVYVNASNPF